MEKTNKLKFWASAYCNPACKLQLPTFAALRTKLITCFVWFVHPGMNEGRWGS